MTLLLYLNGAPPGASGGELRAWVGAEPSDLDGETAVRVDDIQPRGGRLVLFESRKLLHAVRPVGLWRRVALSLWCLRRIPADRLSPLAGDVLGASAFLHLNAKGLARLAMCARAFGKKKDGRSICDEAARQRLRILRNERPTGVRSIDGIDWLVERQIPSWIYCLHDWENFTAGRGRPWKRKRVADEIRHQIHIKGSRAQELVNDFMAELLREARAE